MVVIYWVSSCCMVFTSLRSPADNPQACIPPHRPCGSALHLTGRPLEHRHVCIHEHIIHSRKLIDPRRIQLPDLRVYGPRLVLEGQRAILLSVFLSVRSALSCTDTPRICERPPGMFRYISYYMFSLLQSPAAFPVSSIPDSSLYMPDPFSRPRTS